MQHLIRITHVAPRRPIAIQSIRRGGALTGFRLYSSSSEGPLFDKILIANRGEIACRVIRTARKLGVKTVAVYSEADKNSMHVAMADEAYCVGPAASKESYLRGDRILDIAKRSGAKAIHPGYGFLSENADFADLLERNGIVFIGPPSSAIRDMGSKSASKNIMSAASVPLIPGYHGEDQSTETLMAEADKIGYPVLIKAVLGGGGKGMRIVEKREDFVEQLQGARREAMNSFNDDRVLVEKYIVNPRHVEMQVFADKHGNTVYLFERDCSVQRRHQKVIEEAPAPDMTPELRRRMGEAAVNAARAVGYVGAGTVEFILDPSHHFYFMEMNTRLQVEHPVTEMITRQDLVEWQLKVAAGHPLPKNQSDLAIHGHAFESRIYAENPDNNFLPGTGRLVHLSTPAPTDHVRIDTGVSQGDEVSVYYDPMIAKLVVWDRDRDAALQRMRVALENYRVVGLATNINFLHQLVDHPEFIAGNVETGFIAKHRDALLPGPKSIDAHGTALAATAVLLQEAQRHQTLNRQSTDRSSPFGTPRGGRLNQDLVRPLELLDGELKVNLSVRYRADGSYDITVPGSEKPIHVSGKLVNDKLTAFVNDRLYNCTVVLNQNNLHLLYDGAHLNVGLPVKTYGQTADLKGSLLAPMPGKIVKVLVEPGRHVKKGEPLVIMEAMKMEHTIRAPSDGVVEKVNYGVNELVEEKKMLVVIRADEAADAKKSAKA